MSLAGQTAWGLDHVTLRREGKTIDVEGRLILTARDGGILLLARDGVLWNIVPEEQLKHTQDERPFRPMTAPEVAKGVLAELPSGFEVHQTTHYLIVHNTSRTYAQWCGLMFERLYGAFHNTWTTKGFELSDPEFPLVAVVFADKQSYAKAARKDLGEATDSIIGYYNLATNRMTTYDLTGASRSGRGRSGSSAQINQILASPEASRMVSTVVHEATHQIAFNCGLHARYSDCPLWFSEGVAMYFETPDLRSSKGWAGVGAINRGRLDQFRQFSQSRAAGSFKSLLETDRRFRDVEQGLNAYAEAWALTHFLLRQRPKEYIEYLKMLSKKTPLVQDGPEQRLKEFEKYFGPWEKIDAELRRYVGRMR